MMLKNVFYNLVGLGSPILLALLCIPPLIAAMGTAAFGLLTLVWVVLGYFSIFDLGIGRALTLSVSSRRAAGSIAKIGPVVATALHVTALLGLLGGGLLWLLGGHLAALMTRAEPGLTEDARLALLGVAAALPFVTTTAALRGVLEAYGRFDITSAIRLGMGFVTYGGPLVVLQFKAGLVAVVMFLALARVLTWGIHLVAVRRVLPPADASPRAFSREELRPLLVSGGWMTVSNIISPLLTYLDRFVVAFVVGAATVAFYTTPYEAISRLTIIPEAVLGVLFPALGAAVATDPDRAKRLFSQSLRVMLAVMLPVAAIIVVLAQPLLSAWINADFASQSQRVLQILTIGIAVNCVARVTFTVVQSVGRADLTAKLHLCELPVFLLLLLGLTHWLGIQGAALAWALRASVDFALLLWLQRRLLPMDNSLRWWAVALVPATWGLALLLADRPNAMPWWLGGGLAGVVALGVAAFAILNAEDRQLLGSVVGKLRQRFSGGPGR